MALKRIEELTQESENPDLWNDQEKAQAVMKEKTLLEGRIAEVRSIQSTLEDNVLMIEMGEEEDEKSIIQEAEAALEQLKSKTDKLQLSSLLSGEADNNDAFLEVNAGAGGTEAQDWAEMLLRMYSRYFALKDFKFELTDITAGEEAGIKSATLIVSGPFAYGLCKNETGIHRLVRQSPFNANAKRQTSFAAVDVIPEFNTNYKNIDIDAKDLRIDTYRASGAGGQHVNKTDSAVRITHIPTGIVAQSQSQRSQTANKDTAMKILTARIVTQLELQQKEKINDLKSNNDMAWGNQIRSYVFHPYKMVKDHRTNEETSNIQRIMDGEIDNFIECHLRLMSISNKG